MNQPLHGKAVIRTSQIIAAAMIMGIIFFAGITLVMHVNNQPLPPAAPNQNPMLLTVAAFLTVSALVGRFVVLNALDRNASQKIADSENEDVRPEDVLGSYQTRLIISLALLEGPAFFCLVAFMAENRWESFGLAMFLLLLMAMSFPTENKFRGWIRKLTGRSEYAGDE